MIIVTGVSGGLGSKLLPILAEAGEPVVGTYNRNKPPEVESGSVRFYRVNVADPVSTQQFSKAIERDANRITLVNLAGRSVSKLAIDTAPDEWDDVVDTSLKGSLLMSQAVLKYMIRERWGRIINVSSVVASTATRGTSAYAAAKSGISGLTRVMASEYGRFGILVNSIILGYFDTGMSDQLTQEQRKTVLARIPLGRLGDAAEIAEAIHYIVRANYVNGAEIRIDGGLS